MPKVSVIIPAYNSQAFIKRAIDSVLNQTYQDFEIIVVDDGSEDQTKQTVSGCHDRVKYFYQEHKGISAARNRGIKEAQGQYIAFLDSDDTWVPEKLMIQVEILDNNPKIGIVHNKLIMLDEQGRQIGIKPKHPSGKNFKELLEKGGDLPTSSLMTRRACFEKAGLFDESLPVMEDFEMWLRIAVDHDIFEYQQKPLAYYYRHGRQITKNKIKVLYGTVVLQEKILNTYKGFDQRPVRRKLFHHQYLLARAYYDQKQYSMAWETLVKTITACPLVGTLFYHAQDNVFHKTVKFFKPFGFLLFCSVKRWSS